MSAAVLLIGIRRRDGIGGVLLHRGPVSFVDEGDLGVVLSWKNRRQRLVEEILVLIVGSSAAKLLLRFGRGSLPCAF